MKHVESNNQKGKVNCFFLTGIPIRILEEFRGHLLLFDLEFQFKILGEFHGHLLYIRQEFPFRILEEFYSHCLFFLTGVIWVFSDRNSNDLLPTWKFFMLCLKMQMTMKFFQNLSVIRFLIRKAAGFA